MGIITPREESSHKVTRAEAEDFLKKARRRVASACKNLLNGEPDSAGLIAIHGAIQASDAVLGYTAGIKSVAQDHRSVTKLLKTRVKNYGPMQERQLLGMLGKKNDVEYNSRMLTEEEARILVDQATRYLNWAEEVIAALK